MRTVQIVLSLMVCVSFILAACSAPQPPLPTLASLPTLGATRAGASAVAPTTAVIRTAQPLVVSVPTSAPGQPTPDVLAILNAGSTAQVALTPVSVRSTGDAVAVSTAAKLATSVALIGNGYLWWINDRRVDVMVVSSVHLEAPVDDILAKQWASKGEACFTEAGSQFKQDKTVPAPYYGTGLEVVTGKCKGYKGWAWSVALHAEKP